MRAAFITGYGDNSVVSHGEIAEPTLGPNDALIEVRAAGINPVEPSMRQGAFQAAFPFSFPQVMGFDISGVVITAPQESGFVPGDEVYSRLPSRTQGAYAERVAAPVALLAHKPKSMDHKGAASLPTVALTTWQAFTERAKLTKGESLLIQAGSGGIGSFAIQLAKYLGASVTATAGPSNQTWMADLGADRTIDYSKENFEDGGPYDVVYDGVCGPLVARGIASLKPGGRYVGLVRVADSRAYQEMGLPEEVAAAMSAGVKPYVDQASERGAQFNGILTRPDGSQLREIAAAIDAGEIKATVTKVYALSELAAAYHDLSSGRTRGKLIVVP